ncbi:MAG: autotransporter-associated beta strand repeat-containing protein [Verrucomicrobia bacterium]|nr:autotransporter-associated beta strand repeat-containing protein [Verrucomicrobiota bacterium]
MVITGQATFAQTNAVWDADTNATAGTGGSATWNSTTLTWTTNNGASFFAATNGNYNYQFGGTAGAVTLGANVAGNTLNFTTSGYMLGSSAQYTLAATNGITLADNVNLILRPNSGNLITFSGTGITGGAGSSLTLGSGANTYTNTILFSGGTIAASAPISVNIGSNSRLSFGSATNGAGGNVLFNGVISGNNGISLIGTHTSSKTILAASNSYAGGTTISTVGQVNYSNSAAFGSGAITIAGAGTNYLRSITASGTQNITNSVTINSGSILQLSQSSGSVQDTWSGNIGGAGSLQLGTSSTLYLTGTNSSFGGSYASVSSGTTYLTKIGMAGQNSSIGTNGTILVGGTAATSPTTFRWTGSGNEVSDKLFQLVGNNGLDLRANGATDSSLTINGNINAVTATSRTNIFSGYNGNTLTINGLINEVAGGTNSLTVGQSSTGTVVLGNANNSFSGAVRITQSTAGQTTTLQTANIGNAGAISALGKGSTINIGSTNESAFTVLKYTGTGETTDKIINLSGTNATGQTVSGGATLDQSGSGNLKFTSAMTSTNGTGAKKIYLTGSSTGTGEFAGAIGDFGANTNSLVKTGTGKWSLSGANTYTGATEVREGTLQISSGGSIISTATITNTATLLVNGTAGAVNVETGGSLGGAGTVGAVTLNSGSLLKPGNSPGNLTAASSVWNAGATYEWQITSLTGTAGTDWDLFTVTGGLDLSALSSSATFNLSLDSTGALAGFSDTSEYTWTFAKAAGITGLSSTDAGTDISNLFNILAANFNGGAGPANGFKVVVGETSGGYTSLNLMAVPEPSASSLMGIGLAALMIVRTFRRRQS